MWLVIVDLADGLEEGLTYFVCDAKAKQVLQEELKTILRAHISESISSQLGLLGHGLLC